MTEQQAPYKTERRGGARPGSGRPRTLKDAKRFDVWLDAPTRKILKRLDPKNLSRAIRILAGTEKLPA